MVRKVKVKKLFYKVLTSLAILFFSSSCASILYTPEQRKKNNTVVFQTNINNVSVCCVKNGERIKELGKTSPTETDSIFQLKYTFRKLRFKHLKVEFYGNDLVPKQDRIRRAPRVTPLVGDAALSIFTFGIPLLVDPFNPDFYKVASSSKIMSANLRYTDDFLRREYESILPNNSKSLFDEYAKKYPYSSYRQLAINKRDSIEFRKAVVQRNEKAIDQFITKRPQSIFLAKAQKIKDEMAASRTAFKEAKTTNSANSYEAFVKKYPNSIETQNAYDLMIETAFKEAQNTNTLKASLHFLDHYLTKYESQISGASYKKKKGEIASLIDEQIISESAQSSNNKYDGLKKFWSTYSGLQARLPLLPKCLKHKQLIYDEMFEQLKKTTSSNQSSFLGQLQSDFPNLIKGDRKELDVILSKSKNKRGNLRLYNQQYLSYNTNPYMQTIMGLGRYSHKGIRNNAFENSDIEELQFGSNKLTGFKCYKGSEKLCEARLRNGKPAKVEYYESGVLVKEIHYENGAMLYAYEFENGKNLSLAKLAEKVKEGEQALARNDLDKASLILRSDCNNNYPQFTDENVRLEKALALLEEKEEAVREKERKERERNRQERLRQELSNPQLIGKWLCNNVFTQSYNGVEMRISFEPLDPNFHKKGIVKLQQMSCGFVYNYTISSDARKLNATFYKSTCGSTSGDMTVYIDRLNSLIYYNYKGQQFKLYANSNSYRNNYSNYLKEDANISSSLAGRYSSGSYWIILKPDGTGVGYTDGSLGLENGAKFKWSASDGKVDFEVSTEYGPDLIKWCRYRVVAGRMCLQDNMTTIVFCK